jgi:hypothetical protein
MAKRVVPDFDRAAAFDEALARKNPDLVVRLGGTMTATATGPAAAEAIESPISSPDAPKSAEQPKAEPILKVVPLSNESERPAKPAKRSGRRRGVVARAGGLELRRLTVYVDLELAQRLRKHCFERELNLSEVAAEALKVGLEALIAGR